MKHWSVNKEYFKPKLVFKEIKNTKYMLKHKAKTKMRPLDFLLSLFD